MLKFHAVYYLEELVMLMLLRFVLVQVIIDIFVNYLFPVYLNVNSYLSLLFSFVIFL